MSDFRFSCPYCEQHISCDRSLYNTRIKCPRCDKELIVPNPPAGTSKLSIDTLARTTRHLPGMQPRQTPRMSRLAVAAFVLSLLGPLGFVPALICANYALAAMQRKPHLRGKKLARAALVISSIVLIAMLIALGIYVYQLVRDLRAAETAAASSGSGCAVVRSSAFMRLGQLTPGAPPEGGTPNAFFCAPAGPFQTCAKRAGYLAESTPGSGIDLITRLS